MDELLKNEAETEKTYIELWNKYIENDEFLEEDELSEMYYYQGKMQGLREAINLFRNLGH